MVTLFRIAGTAFGIDPGFLVILPIFSIIIALQLPLYAQLFGIDRYVRPLPPRRPSIPP